MNAARRGHQADARFRQSEARVLGSYDDIARERDFESSPSAKPFTAAMDRLVDVVARGDSGEAALAANRLLQFAAILRGPAQIIAGREALVARARDDRHPRRLVRDEIVPHAVHLDVTPADATRSSARAGERDVGDMVVLLVFNKFQIHSFTVHSNLYYCSFQQFEKCVDALHQLSPDLYARALYQMHRDAAAGAVGQVDARILDARDAARLENPHP